MSNFNPPANAFQPGNTAAKGNDKTLRVSTWLEKELDKSFETGETIQDYENEISRKQRLAQLLIERALGEEAKLSLEYTKEILDRTEGKPAQSVKVSGDGENPIALVISKATDEGQD